MRNFNFTYSEYHRIKKRCYVFKKKWPLINVIPFLRKYGAGVSTS